MLKVIFTTTVRNDLSLLCFSGRRMTLVWEPTGIWADSNVTRWLEVTRKEISPWIFFQLCWMMMLNTSVRLVQENQVRWNSILQRLSSSAVRWASYFCFYAGNTAPGIRSRFATLMVLVPPERPNIVQGDFMVTTEDREIELECVSAGGRPAAEVCYSLTIASD